VDFLLSLICAPTGYTIPVQFLLLVYYIIYLVESSKWWFHILYWTLVCGDDMPRYLMLGDGITGYFEFFFVFNEIV
jgi:hypothetical protein